MPSYQIIDVDTKEWNKDKNYNFQNFKVLYVAQKWSKFDSNEFVC